MQIRIIATLFAAGVALGACVQPSRDPLPSGISPGPGAPPLQQESAQQIQQQPGVQNAPASLTTQGGRQRVQRSGTAPAGSLQAPAEDRPSDPRIGAQSRP